MTLLPRAGTVGATLALALTAGTVGVAPSASADHVVPRPPVVTGDTPRAEAPEDRFALAGGCYALQSLSSGAWVVRTEDGWAATAPDPGAAEAFHLQASDLGRYLLFGAQEEFLAAGGGSVTADPEPSPAADWVVDAAGSGFGLVLPDDEVALTSTPEGELQTAPASAAGTAGQFAFRQRTGCAAWPEVEVNVAGPPSGGSTPWTETHGYLDAHLHTMAFEFVGGASRCGRPWHPYGVEAALVDCPDHEAGGRGAVLEHLLSGTDPVQGHDTVGWPTFGYWPKYDSLTHEQIYYKWLERTWRSGLRMMTTLLVENAGLCKVYPLKENSCNEMDSVRLQAERLRELERYIDAQSGGPGEGWLRIVTDPFQAREVMNSGRLAVVMGIEISQLFDCTLVLEVAGCDEASIDQQLDEVYALGVRQMELANKFDNALSGVTGDEGQTGVIVNYGNKQETGRFWEMLTCMPEHNDHGHDHEHNVDRRQVNPADDTGAPPPLGGRDSIFAGLLQVSGTSVVAPAYGPGPHCNERGLTDLGRHLLGRMVEKGMMFDPDHMSASARSESLTFMEEAGYDGVISSHSWSDDTIYPRIVEMGGIVTPYPRSADYFVEEWRRLKAVAEASGQTWGIGYGADTNGFGAQAGPRAPDAPNPVTYPFTGLGGVTIDQQVSGQRVYDVNVDGVAHYGLYADWIEQVRRLGGPELVADLERGPEAYLQTWERALGVPEQRCHDAAEVDSDAGLGLLRHGMTTEQVLRTAGQPAVRDGHDFRWCTTGSEAVVTGTFDDSGRLIRLDGRALPAGEAAPPAAAPGTRGTLAATGGSTALAALSALTVVAGLALRRRRRLG